MDLNVERLSRKARWSAIEGGRQVGEAISDVLDQAAESGQLFGVEEGRLRSAITEQLEGFGFLERYLTDETIEEVWVNQPGSLHFARNGVHYRDEVAFSAGELSAIVERLIRSSGRRLDRTTPFIDAQLQTGYRLHAVIPDITKENLSLNIRKFSSTILTLDFLVNRGVLKSNQAEYLVAAAKAGQNILISGATQAGKTTILSALLSALEPSERVVSVEDTFELRCSLPDWVALQTRPASLEGKGEIDLRRLVRETLRMRPTRLVVGEVRGAEALDMLIALNSGIPGMCTIHANSSQEALQKLATLPLLAGGNISSEFLTSVIRSSMQLFVHCKRGSDGSRKVESIMKVALGDPLSLEEVEC